MRPSEKHQKRLDKYLRILDPVLLGIAGLLLLPILIAAAPILLLIAALWPVLILPWLGLHQAMPGGEDGFREEAKKLRRKSPSFPKRRSTPQPA